MARKEPTWTSLVLELLSKRDDFMTAKQIVAELGGIDTRTNYNRITAALIHLRKFKAVDCIIEPDGIAWWFATIDTDTRTRLIDERTPELKPRNRKKGYRRKPKAPK